MFLQALGLEARPEALAQFQRHIRALHLRRGERLINFGDTFHDIVLVISGKLRIDSRSTVATRFAPAHSRP